MVRMRKTVIFLIIFTLVISIFNISYKINICSAEGTTLHAGVGQEYTYIQDAINASNESDTILVYSGTYIENIVINKSINLVGENKDTTIIHGTAGNNVIKISKEVPLDYISNINISGFKILQTPVKNYIGIFIEYVTNCKISDCIIKDCSYGIWMKQTDASTISNNIIENSESGILLSLYSEENTIEGNVIINNNIGISLQDYSNDNIIKDNDIIYHTKYGLWVLGNCDNNMIYHNTLYNNEKNAFDEGSNTYDNGYPSGGNYWGDYNGQDNSPQDGIGDTAYDVPGGSNQDNYPLGNFLLGKDPVAEIISVYPNPATQGQTIYFYGQGTDDTTITDWEWRAGSDIIGQQEHIEYSGLPVGSYTISFRVKDTDEVWSEWDIYEQSLYVNAEYTPEHQPPTAIILTDGPLTSNYTRPISFSGIGEDVDGHVVLYNWSSNIDGLISQSPSFTILNLSLGAHTITFKVRDDDNLWSETDEIIVTITQGGPVDNKKPVALTTGPYIGIVNESVIFDGTRSYDTDGLILLYTWSFGDGNTAIGEIVNHSYNRSQEFIVTLTVTDNYGKENTTITKIRVNPATIEDNNQSSKKDGLSITNIVIIIIIIAFALAAIIISKKKKNSK